MSSMAPTMPPRRWQIALPGSLHGAVTFALLAPLVLFVIVAFLLPIGQMLLRSIDNTEVRAGLPRTVAALETWSGAGIPDAAAFDALAADIRDAALAQPIQLAARRLNYEIPAFRSLLQRTARTLRAQTDGNAQQLLVDVDARWNDREVWAAIKRSSSGWTGFFLLNALDLRRNADNDIVSVPEGQQIYRVAFLRTFLIGGIVTLVCVLLGYPLAYLISISSAGVAALLITLVLIPLWTSVLVRSTAWIVLLQSHGPVVESLLWLGVISERISLVFNRAGVLIAMVHVLLPYCVLSIYGNIKAIDPRYFCAALSLGATPAKAFLTVYLPQTVPGIGAGALLTFTLAIGYYITPELVGGGGDQMISHFIAQETIALANWGQASALCVVLLCVVAIIYGVYARWFGLNQLSERP